MGKQRKEERFYQQPVTVHCNHCNSNFTHTEQRDGKMFEPLYATEAQCPLCNARDTIYVVTLYTTQLN